jgi:hypothetical protein
VLSLVVALLALVGLVGGWLGGALVFAHGMRVVGDEDAPVERAARLGEEQPT